MPTIRIDDEVWTYLKSKATPFEDTPNDVLRRELKILPTQRPASSPAPVPQGNRARLAPDRDYSYQAIKGFSIDWVHKEGKTVPCSSFSEMLKSVCSYLWLRHMDTFAAAALPLHGKKRPYFSKNAADLRKPHRLAASDIFVETNLSANNVVGICRLLLEKLGRDPNSLKIV